jgi:hypothetical protein
MRRWVGVSAAVGSATVAALTGSAWAGPVGGAVPVQRASSSTEHRCGHADTITVRQVTPVGGGAAEAVVLEAVDGAGDPVEAAFDGTTLRVGFPAQRSRRAGGVTGGSAAGAPSAVVRTVLPAGARAHTYEVEAAATFDDGITGCTWTTQVVVPPAT